MCIGNLASNAGTNTPDGRRNQCGQTPTLTRFAQLAVNRPSRGCTALPSFRDAVRQDSDGAVASVRPRQANITRKSREQTAQSQSRPNPADPHRPIAGARLTFWARRAKSLTSEQMKVANGCRAHPVVRWSAACHLAPVVTSSRRPGPRCPIEFRSALSIRHSLASLSNLSCVFNQIR